MVILAIEMEASQQQVGGGLIPEGKKPSTLTVDIPLVGAAQRGT
jgi:hypothetical protein